MSTPVVRSPQTNKSRNHFPYFQCQPVSIIIQLIFLIPQSHTCIMETQRSSTDSHFLSDNEKDELALLDAVVADYEKGKGYRKPKSWIRRHWKAVCWHLLFNAFTLVLLVYGIGDIWDITGLCKNPIYGLSNLHILFEFESKLF